jgi:hypothetical protein
VTLQGSDSDESDPLYSNFLKVGFNAFEFLLGFGNYRSADEEPRKVRSIVTSPAFAKAFSNTLSKSIEDYEVRYGKIPDVAD